MIFSKVKDIYLKQLGNNIIWIYFYFLKWILPVEIKSKLLIKLFEKASVVICNIMIYLVDVCITFFCHPKRQKQTFVDTFERFCV